MFNMLQGTNIGLHSNTLSVLYNIYCVKQSMEQSGRGSLLMVPVDQSFIQCGLILSLSYLITISRNYPRPTSCFLSD